MVVLIILSIVFPLALLGAVLYIFINGSFKRDYLLIRIVNGQNNKFERGELLVFSQGLTALIIFRYKNYYLIKKMLDPNKNLN